MTNDTKAPERIWAGAIADHTLDGYATRVWGDDPRVGTDNKPVEYIRHDHALSLVATAYEDAAKETSDQERVCSEWWQKTRKHPNVYDQLDVFVSRILARTPADAQAALDARDQRIRDKALREAAMKVQHYYDKGQVTKPDDILALIEKDKTDE